MSLDKARAALDAARLMNIDEAEADQNGLTPIRLVEPYNRLINIAQTQAAIAQADACERIADALEALLRRPHVDVHPDRMARW